MAIVQAGMDRGPSRMRTAAAVSIGWLIAILVSIPLTLATSSLAYGAVALSLRLTTSDPPAVLDTVVTVLEILMFCLVGWLSALVSVATGEQWTGKCGVPPRDPPARTGPLRAILAYIAGVLTGLLFFVGVAYLWPIGYHPLMFIAAANGTPTVGLLAARAILRR